MGLIMPSFREGVFHLRWRRVQEGGGCGGADSSRCDDSISTPRQGRAGAQSKLKSILQSVIRAGATAPVEGIALDEDNQESANVCLKVSLL